MKTDTDELADQAEKKSSAPRQAQTPRQNWDAHFQRMAKNGDDRLLDGQALPLTRWRAEE